MAFDPRSIMKSKNVQNSENNDQNKKNKFININNKPKMQLQKLPKEDILNVVKNKGPVTPTEIKRELNAETYLISAILSELVNSHIIKTTSVKKGTSIFYYFPSQETKLESLISFLNEKDQRTVNLLKEKKVLEDKTQELLIRVSIRKIKDYAKPINIRISEDEIKLFWKYFLVSDEEAKSVIREILKPFIEKKQEKVKETLNNQNTQKTKSFGTLKTKGFNRVIGTNKLESKPQEQEEIKKEKPKIKEKEIETKTQDNKIINTNKLVPKESQLELSNEIDDKLQKDKEFLRIKEKMIKNNITIESASIIKKTKEFDMIIRMKTPIGVTRFFAKYKNKKRSNDADISNAVVIGQSKQMPIAFITSGELSKKAREQVNKLFKNVMIVEGF